MLVASLASDPSADEVTPDDIGRAAQMIAGAAPLPDALCGARGGAALMEVMSSFHLRELSRRRGLPGTGLKVDMVRALLEDGWSLEQGIGWSPKGVLVSQTLDTLKKLCTVWRITSKKHKNIMISELLTSGWSPTTRRPGEPELRVLDNDHRWGHKPVKPT